MQILASLLILTNLFFLQIPKINSQYSTAPWDSSENTKCLGRFDGCLCRQYMTQHYTTCYDPENCRRFPRSFKPNFREFKLATTGVENITVGDLSNFTELEILKIEANKELKWIEEGAFANMTKLKSLSISYNSNLQYLIGDVFEGLAALENLTIRHNSFENIRSFSMSLQSRFMPNLKRLELNELRCISIMEDDFQYLEGSSLVELDLVDSQVEYIHSKALLPLKNLKVLNLGENLINSSVLIDILEEFTLNNISLRTLSLYGWGFRKYVPKDVLATIANSTITELILSKNQFDVIFDGVFPYMPGLEILHLNDVLLSNFTFSAFSNLPKLRTLCLTGNKFQLIPKGEPGLRNLKELVIRRAGLYFSLENDTFVNMTGLERLDLSSNNIRKFPRNSFRGLINLRYMNLKNSTIFFLDGRIFEELKSLTFLSLETNPFPNRTFTPEIFYGLENLKELELGYCAIEKLPKHIFKYLIGLKRLDLRGNRLKMLSFVVFAPLTQLEILDLGWNLLSSWNMNIFRQNHSMKSLILNNNKLTHFTQAMLEDILNLVNLDMSGNLFNCQCRSFRAFSHLNESLSFHILGLLKVPNTKCVTERYTDFTIVEYYNKLYLGSECTKTLTDIFMDYILPLLIVLIISTLTAIILYTYRWHIRYWIFLTKMFLSRRAQFHRNINLQGHDNYLYDAFVSYSNEDRNFVVRLVGMLENYEPFLKLCVYERDFEIGAFISENVLECVSRSRKTLLVISNSYIKSQWCRWEAQVAENHRLFFENEYGECVNDSIIMIKLGNISQHNLSPMLKYLMKTRIYLQWDSDQTKQNQFWEKLRNALAPPASPYAAKKADEAKG